MDKSDKNESLRRLPSVDTLLQTAAAIRIAQEVGAKYLTELARRTIEGLRNEIGDANFSREDLLEKAESKLENVWRGRTVLRRVINATGVIIHTNLGRAPLSENAVKALTEEASRYCTLEFDLRNGKRGKRGAAVENLLCELTGAEAALVVNNCAAAAFLVLTALAKNGEVIVSRGELVEIGGDFRVPDVMEQSGAILKEVGTTNRTRISDYEQAIFENTRLIARVHPSNYRIVGFTHTPELAELAELTRRREITLYEDAGSGALIDLSRFGLTDEPVIADSIKNGADVVTFSGDKLLGGAQSGLIVGRREIIEKIRRHSLYRTLRADKLIYAALEATLLSFRRETALREIPVLRMISMTETEIEARAKKFIENLRKKRGDSDLQIETEAGKSAVGGGSAPLTSLATRLIKLQHTAMSATKLEEHLRLSEPPIITRVSEDKVLIDLRTVSEIEEAELLEVLARI